MSILRVSHLPPVIYLKMCFSDDDNESISEVGSDTEYKEEFNRLWADITPLPDDMDVSQYLEDIDAAISSVTADDNKE